MLPKVFKEYYCYDDGKISHSRQYKVLITNIIPYSEVKDFLLDACNYALEHYNDLYKEEQKYVIFGVSYEESIPRVEIFLETKNNEWFGIGEWDYYNKCLSIDFCSGLLDITGELTEKLEQSTKQWQNH